MKLHDFNCAFSSLPIYVCFLRETILKKNEDLVWNELIFDITLVLFSIYVSIVIYKDLSTYNWIQAKHLETTFFLLSFFNV